MCLTKGKYMAPGMRMHKKVTPFPFIIKLNVHIICLQLTKKNTFKHIIAAVTNFRYKAGLSY